MMFDAGYAASALESGRVQVAARSLGFEVASYEIRRAEDIAPVFEALKSQADALYITENFLIFANGKTIVGLALNAQLPTTVLMRIS
jgi:ABC-type uncharacterized transport system substrate-binding protein